MASLSRKMFLLFRFRIEILKNLLNRSQAVVAGRTVYVAGCLGLDKDTMKLVPGGAGAEMRKAFENMNAILEAAGSSADKVTKVNIFVTDMKDFAAINEEYKKGDFRFLLQKHFVEIKSCPFYFVTVFTKDFPARTGVEISNLAAGAKVEFDVVAVVGDVKIIAK